MLCTVSCAGALPTAIPKNGGTNYIVLQLWNKNTVDIPIRNIQVNGVIHTWDVQTRNQLFDGKGSYPSYPAAGKFSIIHHSNGGSPIQFENQTMRGDQEVRLVIKLSSLAEGDLVPPNIGLGEPLHILVKIGDAMNPAEFVILSGDTK